jgi:hypothetical protein
VAALYFSSPAARTGYGGYLGSDVVPNPYLTGGAVKKTVGYPVDGSIFGVVVTPGKLYATPLEGSAASFTQANDQVYTAPWFLSFPGNSGGPVYVQHQNGYSYPAAVYLGMIPNAQGYLSVVRAIDSKVVNMINHAAQLGDAGTNFTGGGVIMLIANQPVSPSHPAYVQVQLGPDEALAAGAGWRISGDAAYSTGTNYTRAITTTNAAIEFKLVPNWLPPASRAVNIIVGKLTIVSNAYQYLPPTLMLDSSARLWMSGATGAVYQVESSDALAEGSWTPYATNAPSLAGLNLVKTNAIGTNKARVFRAHYLP